MKITFSDIVRLPFQVLWFCIQLLGAFVLGMLDAEPPRRAQRGSR